MGRPVGLESPPVAKPRLVCLDLLRFVAVFLVLGRHMPPPPADCPAGVKTLLETWIRGGWIGVDLFFVLSGFLVSGLLFGEFKQRGRIGVARFYVRRGWKIYPPFYALMVFAGLVFVLNQRPIPLEYFGPELIFVQNYMQGVWDHTWSLAVEEHFYLLLPLVMVLVLRLNRGSGMPLKPIVWIAAVSAVAALALRIWTAIEHPPSNTTPFSEINLRHTFPTHLRIDALFFGVALSYFYQFDTARFVRVLTPWRRGLIALGLLALVPPFLFRLEATPFLYTIGFTLNSLGSGALLVGLLLGDGPHSRMSRILAAIGAYSYSIYLWHLAWLIVLLPTAEGAFGGRFLYGPRLALYFAGSVALGVLMAFAVEVPSLWLRDRWFPRRDPGPIEPARAG